MLGPFAARCGGPYDLPLDHCLKPLGNPDVQIDDTLVTLTLASVSASNGEDTVCLGLVENEGPVALVALHSDSDGLGPAVRLAPAGVSDQRGPRCCEASLASFR